ncbi:hypothetical protein CI238_07324, partial [Colletotrichum incanum]
LFKWVIWWLIVESHHALGSFYRNQQPESSQHAILQPTQFPREGCPASMQSIDRGGFLIPGCGQQPQRMVASIKSAHRILLSIVLRPLCNRNKKQTTGSQSFLKITRLLILLRPFSIWTDTLASTGTSTASTVPVGSTFTVPGARTALCTTGRLRNVSNESSFGLVCYDTARFCPKQCRERPQSC